MFLICFFTCLDQHVFFMCNTSVVQACCPYVYTNMHFSCIKHVFRHILDYFSIYCTRRWNIWFSHALDFNLWGHMLKYKDWCNHFTQESFTHWKIVIYVLTETFGLYLYYHEIQKFSSHFSWWWTWQHYISIYIYKHIWVATI